MKRNYILRMFVIGALFAGCASDQNGEDVRQAIQPVIYNAFTVYSNGKYATGWVDGTTATHNSNSGTVLHNGLRTLSVTYRPWQWTDASSTTGVSGYDAVGFYIYGGANTTSPMIHMELQTSAGWFLSPRIASYCDGGKISANKWTYCQIPFSAAGVAAGTAVTAVSFDEDGGRSWKVVYYSNIQFLQTIPPTGGTGGATSTGGSSSVTGGSSAIAGTTSVAGSSSMGGTSSAGGSSATGGSSPLGGNASTGGSVSGGSMATGGTTSVSEGGTSAVAGSSSTGGAATGGSSASVGGDTSTGGMSAIGGSTSVLSLHRTAFTPLPTTYGALLNSWSNAEPKVMKDSTPGKAGEIFGFGCPSNGTLVMYKTGDYGQSWSLIPSTESTPLITVTCEFLTAVQDSGGTIHYLYKNGWNGYVEYDRFQLEYTGTQISGFHAVVRELKLPGEYNTNVDIRATLQVMKDQSGASSLVYEVNENPGTGFRMRMGVATSLTPMVTADFVKLDGTAGASLIFESTNFNNHDHHGTFASIGSSHDIWVLIGAMDAEYGQSAGDTMMRRIRLTPSGAHTWSVGTPIDIIDWPYPNPQLFHVYGAQNHVWIMSTHPVDGVVFDSIDATGAYVHNAVPPMEAYRDGLNGNGVFSVSPDEQRVYAVANTFSGGPGNDDRTTQAYWDGFNWTKFSDTMVGDMWGLGSSTGWDEGVVCTRPSDPGNILSLSMIGRY